MFPSSRGTRFLDLTQLGSQAKAKDGSDKGSSATRIDLSIQHTLHVCSPTALSPLIACEQFLTVFLLTDLMGEVG